MNRKEDSKKIIYRSRQVLLPPKVIFSAISGDEKAIQKVVQHYEKYIDRLASRELYDRYGNLYIYHDPVLKTELQNKLIAGVLKFNINR